MKIQGPGKTQEASKTKKSEKSGSAQGGFGDLVSAGDNKTAATEATGSIAMVDALLAVQETENPTEKASRGRMRKRADVILNELDGLRDAMLRGNLTLGHMIDVADVVASHREKIADPELTALMDEIDLRAQVELAKMRIQLDKQGCAQDS